MTPVSPDPINLRNGVLISGVNAVGTITNTDLAAGGTKTQVLRGLRQRGAPTIRRWASAAAPSASRALSLANGSTLFVNGAANHGRHRRTLTNSTISMIDGAADDVFTLGGLTLNNGHRRLRRGSAARSRRTGSSPARLTATGTNIVNVNLLGTPVFTGQTDIPIVVTGGPVAGTFVAQGLARHAGLAFHLSGACRAQADCSSAPRPANFGLRAGHTECRRRQHDRDGARRALRHQPRRDRHRPRSCQRHRQGADLADLRRFRIRPARAYRA